MIEILKDYGLFLAKMITVVIAFLMVVSAIVTALRRERESDKRRIEIEKVNDHFDYLRESLQDAMQSKHERKMALKERKRQRKEDDKLAKKNGQPRRKKTFVLDFKGDIHATAVAALREEVTALLTVAQPEDEVVLRLESAGGAVNSYGLAASQLLRIKQKEIPLKVAVDKIAASGGYMIASVADVILAAPFAVIGSIGVLSQIPNFHRLLKKNDIDFEEITAGEYKRTLTIFGENTDSARQKFTEQIEDTHAIFKEFVSENRTELDVDTVATGEYWYGKRALEMNLVDRIITSDDYLLAASEESDIYEVTYKPKESLREKIASGFESTVNRILFSWWNKSQNSQFV